MRVKGSRRNKAQVVEHIQQTLATSCGFVLTNYRGMTVAEITALRQKLREQGAEYHVAKNTLLARALGSDAARLGSLLEGPTAIAILREDAVPGTKALLDYFRELRKPEVIVKGAFIEGRVLDADGVVALSKLPPRPVILGQVLGTIQAPLNNFAGTLHGVLSEFARTLQALVDQRQSQTAA